MGNLHLNQHQPLLKNDKVQFKLKSNINQKQFTTSFKEKLNVFGFSPIWRIENKVFHKKNFQQALNLLQQIKARQLYLNKNMHSKIIKNIAQIKFPKLTVLHLSNNLISSLQFIGYLDSPKLLSLNLSDNLICKVNCLTKCNFANILYLNIQNNFIKDFQNLSKFRVKQLYELSIVVHKLLFLQPQNDNRYTKEANKDQVEWIAKLQPKQIQTINIKNEEVYNPLNLKFYDFILQPKEIRILKKRFYCSFASATDFQKENRW